MNNTISANNTRNSQIANMTDSELAAALQLQESKKAAVIRSDRRMAQSLADAVHADQRTLLQCFEEDRVSARDRAIARQLNGDRTATAHPNPQEADPIDGILLAKLAARYVSEDAGEKLYQEQQEQQRVTSRDGSVTASSSRYDSSANEPKKFECSSCLQDFKFFQVASAPCGDSYCQDCLQELYLHSFKDQSLFPPRCHRNEFQLKDVAIFLTAEIKQEFKDKKLEYSTNPRTYCSQCHKFVPPNNIDNKVATCPACASRTCTGCTRSVHQGSCKEDADKDKVLELGNEKGWKTCPNCHELIELSHGCYHMTCRCRFQFCYLCQAPWKNCACAQWEEQLLLEQVQRREGQLLNLNRMREAIEDLRQNHNCRHLSWSSMSGAYRCEECSQRMPQFIYRCTQCHIRVCRRCKNNRL